MNFKGFRKFCKEQRKNITVKGTAAQWPYNHGTRLAYVVTMNNITKYFYFNSDGLLIDQKDLTQSN